MNLTPKLFNFRRLNQGFVLVVGLLALMACQAQTDGPDPTKYRAVNQPIPVTTGDKVEVAELFWFKCGHCYALEPALKRWSETMPENAELVKIPAVLNSRWAFEAQAYYTMQALDVPQKAYDNYFMSIHVQRKYINSVDDLSEFLAEFGKTPEQVKSAFASFAVDTNMRYAKRAGISSGATGVPAIIVDGKYITSVTDAGSVSEMFEVVNQLIKKAESER